jgi:hypothetical protein
MRTIPFHSPLNASFATVASKHRGVARIAGGFLLNLIAYNLIRIPKLVAA